MFISLETRHLVLGLNSFFFFFLVLVGWPSFFFSRNKVEKSWPPTSLIVLASAAGLREPRSSGLSVEMHKEKSREYSGKLYFVFIYTIYIIMNYELLATWHGSYHQPTPNPSREQLQI